jgi:acetylornithine deacetylase/succinyl-diaminopimelate desuccinylase-like protein
MTARLRIAIAAILICAAGVAALLWYNHRAGRDIESQMLYVPRKAHITPEIELLRKYIRIDTVNPPGNEVAGARFLAGLLEKGGVHAEVIESAPGRGNVYARIRGRQRGEGLLLFNHIDVMPAPPQGWTHPPFAAVIALNMLYGRGSLDMKGIAIPELEGILEVAREGRQPERDIVFLGVADEEAGGTWGTRWLLAHRPDVFEGIRYAVNEGGVTETQQEELTYFGVEIGTKMVVKTRLRAASHERMQQLRIALEPYMSAPDPDRILPEVRDFLHDIAPHRIEQGPLLADIAATVAAGKFWLLNRSYKELMQNIIWPAGILEDSHGATMEVSLFNLPDEDPDRRLAWLQGVIAPYGAAIEEVLDKNGPAPLTSIHTPFFTLLEQQVHRQYGDVPVGPYILAAWSNDSRFLRAKGIACYGMWPFPVDFFQTQGIHSVDERVRLDWFMQGVTLMRQLVHSYAFDRRQ